MYKLIVLATILACAAAAPGLIGAGYAAPGLIGAGYGAHGLIGSPVAPWGGIASGYVGAPIVKTAVPVATSYANTVRIASPALAVAHAPVVAAHAPIVAAPAYAHGW